MYQDWFMWWQSTLSVSPSPHTPGIVTSCSVIPRTLVPGQEWIPSHLSCRTLDILLSHSHPPWPCRLSYSHRYPKLKRSARQTSIIDITWVCEHVDTKLGDIFLCKWRGKAIATCEWEVLVVIFSVIACHISYAPLRPEQWDRTSDAVMHLW